MIICKTEIKKNTIAIPLKIKYSSIHFTKYIQDLYPDNHKMLMKEKKPYIIGEMSCF